MDTDILIAGGSLGGGGDDGKTGPINIFTIASGLSDDALNAFEIPLSAMVPVRLKNLIPACKNIGTTHLTNGCFREHPTEWNIGETAGHLAAYCIGKGIRPAQVLGDVKPFQKLLEENGVQLHWDTSSMKK